MAEGTTGEVVAFRGSLVPKPKPHVPTTSPAALRRQAEDNFAGSFEDGALLAGGLLGTIAAALSAAGVSASGVNETDLIVGGLFVAAAGKAIPSLLREIRNARARSEAEADALAFPSPPSDPAAGAKPASCPLFDPAADPANDGNSVTRRLEMAADGFLLFFAVMAALTYLLALPGFYFLLFFGVAFVLKAIADIAEDLYIATFVPSAGNPSPTFLGKPGTPRGPEDMLFLVFGLSAVVLAVWAYPAVATASAALGVSALGKAFPSIVTSKSSSSSGAGGGGSSSGGTLGSYEITLSIPQKDRP